MISSEQHRDERGFLSESFTKDAFEAEGITDEFVHEFYTRSVHSVLRGLHFQISPHSQSRIVSCLEGQIFDVVVDIRPDSPTFKQYVCTTLNPSQAMYVPEGFAHGFLTVGDTAIVHYKTDTPYAQDHYHGIRWNDPQLDIPWPDAEYIISERDRSHPFLEDLRKQITLPSYHQP